MNPADGFATTQEAAYTCVKCPKCGAASALLAGGSECHQDAEIDSDLLTVVFGGKAFLDRLGQQSLRFALRREVDEERS